MITPDKFKEVVSHFATGVTIVTGKNEEKNYGFTCQTFLSLSLNPPLIAIAVSMASTSWPKIYSSGFFAVNVLTRGQTELANTFAISGIDKFKDVKFDIGVTGSPLLNGCLGYIEAEIERVIPAGDHFVVVAKVIDLSRRPGEPLLYFKSKFGKFI